MVGKCAFVTVFSLPNKYLVNLNNNSYKPKYIVKILYDESAIKHLNLLRQGDGFNYEDNMVMNLKNLSLIE